VGAAAIKDSDASKAVLNAALDALKKNANVKIRVEGHTDNDGDPAKNKALGQKRAAAVVTWLTGKGVDAKRLRAVGCGDVDPLVPNTSPENKARNRRTEFDVEEQDGKKPEGYTEPCAPNPAHDKK
jgi:outer membrane protein OmpA-like peptidoglycan-associated protein